MPPKWFEGKFCKLIFLLLCLWVGGAQADAIHDVQSVDIAGFDRHLVLNENLVYLEEGEDRTSVADFVALAGQSKWQRSAEAVPNLGLGVTPHWFAIRLVNSGQQDEAGMLEMPYTMLDLLDVYFVAAGEVSLLAQTGDQRPFSERALAHRSFLIPVELKAGEDALLLIRAESYGALKLPLELWSLKAFFEYDQLAIAPQLAFAGLMLALALYNFFLLLGTRDFNYLWYVLSVISISFVVMSFHGVLAQYAWPEWPQLNNPVLVASISTNIFAACLFAYSFLNLGRFSWWVKAIFLGHSGAGLVCFVLNLFLPYIVTIKLVALFSVTGATCGIITGSYLWYRGEVLARFYTIAWFLLLAGSVTITFSHFGWLPSIFLFEYGQQIGAVAEGLLLSFALAYRMNMERRKRYEAQAQLLQVQTDANQQLEARVAERTNELAEANQKLLEMSLTDGLTQVKNRKFLDQRMEQEWSKAKRDTLTMCLLMIDGDHFKGINDKYGHLGGDAVLKHLANILQSNVSRSGDFVARYGGEEFAVMLSNTDLQGAAVVAERVRKAVAETPVEWEGHTIVMTISIGVAGMRPGLDQGIDALVGAADAALYDAKKAGRNRVVVAPSE
ncbi:sensor domain-containing diguanylate cyclase [Ketobacter alkanivorans]|uniref:diguanylate cyclase n=1 Tax=Ketobacter alkanivorans TaxID=1917421 RepID=A0A2K9LPN1_9GAMM|nr:diguanylate cyclase [Ketobacter alkanivorans]AUM12784.1 hypothetical protein Kalk_10295 [Ketobacter alkanivorans]